MCRPFSSFLMHGAYGVDGVPTVVFLLYGNLDVSQKQNRVTGSRYLKKKNGYPRISANRCSAILLSGEHSINLLFNVS